ncbi:tetratricopeptide repeat protein [Candidatus Obscuribacterales bacterium]|nr:tetratricopeptide repeat protein [Candidatus Obscuribacterales bacterium]
MIGIVSIIMSMWLFAGSFCNANAAPPPTKDHEFFSEFKRLHSKSPLIPRYEQAIEALDHGKHKTALRLFTQLAKDDPSWPGFWTSLGTCYMWTEDFQKGLNCSTKALQLRPKDPDMYNRQAMLLTALMKNAEAISVLSKGLKIDQTDVDLLKRRAACYKAMKKYPEALADVDRLLKSSPREETIYYTKAEVHEAMKDWKGAIDSYSALLKQYPNDDHVLVKRATARMKQNDFKGAVIDYSNALKRGTEGPDFVYSQRAIAYEKLGMMDKAARDRQLAKQEKSF